MARYKRYKVGGKTVPGMYKQDGGGNNMMKTESLSPDRSMINTMRVNNGDTTRTSRPNPYHEQTQMLKMQAIEQKQKMQQQMQMQKMMMQMKLQNENLMQQNQLLKTQIEKNDLINSARTTKTMNGPKSTPKRRGGRVKFPANGFAGNAMKRGGSCLPGGAYSKKKRR